MALNWCPHCFTCDLFPSIVQYVDIGSSIRNWCHTCTIARLSIDQIVDSTKNWYVGLYMNSLWRPIMLTVSVLHSHRAAILGISMDETLRLALNSNRSVGRFVQWRSQFLHLICGGGWTTVLMLTYLGLDEMATMWQTKFWNAISWMKTFEFHDKYDLTIRD